MDTIDGYLKAHRVPGIAGIDTRALTLHIREAGDMRAVLVQNAASLSDEALVTRAQNAPLPGEYDAVGQVANPEREELPADGPHVVVVDCGVKRNIVRSLAKRGARVTIVPFGTSLAEIEALQPDGVIISPGPGDPASQHPEGEHQKRRATPGCT